MVFLPCGVTRDTEENVHSLASCPSNQYTSLYLFAHRLLVGPKSDIMSTFYRGNLSKPGRKARLYIDFEVPACEHILFLFKSWLKQFEVQLSLAYSLSLQYTKEGNYQDYSWFVGCRQPSNQMIHKVFVKIHVRYIIFDKHRVSEKAADMVL